VLTEVGLRGAVVIVTGAGSWIGAATARQLGTVGAPVVLVGRREAPLKEVAAQIAAGGGEALCVPADLADPASPQRIADACLDRYGRIDGLVNNAAVVAPEEVANWITLLLSPLASFMTGAVIPLDGGQVIDRE
jgi:NAD(P)-dependent dehydrogenase (short-subunit alcohol dehydrogenase family)